MPNATVVDHRNKPRIAMIDEEFPYPANSGKRLRTLNLLKRLAPVFDITYVAHRNADDAELEPAKRYLQSLGIGVVEVARKVPPKRGLRFLGRLFVNLFSPLPYSVATHVSAEMKTELRRLSESTGIQLWHCEWTPYAQLFRDLDLSPVVIAAHNVESMIWKRYAETESNRFARWYIRRQWKKFESFERWAFRRTSRLIAVSDADANVAIKEFGAREVDVVENGVNVDQYDATITNRNPRQLIFVGSLDWRPNLDGLRLFINRVLPDILKAERGVVLDIVGRNPAAAFVEEIKSKPYIRLHPNAADVVPYLSSAGLMVVPLRVGSGSRLKIIEAAANGLPIVSTRIGAEGLAFQDGVHCLIANTIEEMAKPILRTISNFEAARERAARARTLAETRYDWDILVKKQAAVWQSAINGNR